MHTVKKLVKNGGFLGKGTGFFQALERHTVGVGAQVFTFGKAFVHQFVKVLLHDIPSKQLPDDDLTRTAPISVWP